MVKFSQTSFPRFLDCVVKVPQAGFPRFIDLGLDGNLFSDYDIGNMICMLTIIVPLV